VYVLAYDDTPLIPILHLSFLFSLDFLFAGYWVLFDTLTAIVKFVS